MNNELGNTPIDKNYKPSGISKEEELADEYQRNHEQLYHVDSYPIAVVKELERNAYICGMKQAQTEIAENAKFSSGMDGFYYGHGYRDGKKDTIERAVKWLQEHANEYIVDIAVETYPDAPQKLVVGGMCWVYMKLALEGEENE